jgi:hypothetical protein
MGTTYFKNGKWRQESTVAYIRRRKLEKDADLSRAAVKDRRKIVEVQKMIDQEQAAIERHLVGESGHWIEPRETAGDGHQCHGFTRGPPRSGLDHRTAC